MSNPPQVIPIQLDLDDCDLDDDFEMPTKKSESGLVGTVLGLLKSPFVIGGIAVVVIGIVAALMLTSGSLNPFGTPKLNHNGALAGDSGEVSDELVAQPKLEGEGDDEDDTSEEEEEKEEPLPEYGSISYSSSGAVYHTAPTTVTVTIGERTGDLTISMGILADPVTADFLLQEGLAVNLLKIESAQNLDFGPYLEWQMPGLITKDFRQRLAQKYPELPVDGIMLRDFRLTQS